jgi:multidrug efflux pump subunit AcrB
VTVIACLSMLLAIFWSITCLRATGNTINAMTLGGLALAIGPLVDTAIVVLENTHRHQSLGKSRFKAALDGAAEVTVPVLIATLATIIVLCPIARMPGMGGFLFMPLTLALACAMLAAFVLSQTLVPMLCSKWLGTGTHVGAEHASEGLGGGIHARIEYALSCLTRQYGRVLAWALRHRGPVLVGVGLLFLASLGLAGGIGREFFPQVDAGMITLYVRAPSNMRLDAAEKRIAQVERFLEQHVPENERQMIVTELGLDPDWSAAYTANAGQQDAAIRLQLSDERSRSAQEYAIYLRDLLGHDRRFNDLRISFDTGGMVSAALNYGASSPIDVQIAGGSFDQAMDLAKEIKNRVTWDEASQKGVRGTADVHVQQRLDAPYLVFEVDRKKAANEGLSAEDVILQVVAAMNSSVSINRNFWIDNKSGNQYFVAVQYPENKNITLDDVLNIDATGTDQAHTVKLRQLVHIKHRSDAVEINHTSLYRTVDVLINTAGRDIGGVAGDINKRLAGLQPEIDKKVRLLERQHAVLLNGKRPETKAQLLDLEQEINGLKSLRWELRGEYQRMNESWGSLFWGAVIAVFLVYLLMVPLFRSYLGPLIILITVPLGLIGVLTMLYVTHTTLNVQSEMGVIFLVGIVVSNGVLLMDFANKQRRLGADVHKAITTAAAIRFRPIMMTFLATSLDLIPMAIGLGRGSEANVPLARAVVGGLLTSTFLTLIVVPILFTLLMGQGKEAEFDIDAELADAPVLTPVVAHALPGHTPEGFPAVVGAPTNHQADEDGFGERPG